MRVSLPSGSERQPGHLWAGQQQVLMLPIQFSLPRSSVCTASKRMALPIPGTPRMPSAVTDPLLPRHKGPIEWVSGFSLFFPPLLFSGYTGSVQPVEVGIAPIHPLGCSPIVVRIEPCLRGCPLSTSDIQTRRTHPDGCRSSDPYRLLSRPTREGGGLRTLYVGLGAKNFANPPTLSRQARQG